MRMSWWGLDERDQRLFWMTVEFLEGRLCETQTLEWAMALPAEREAERRAVAHLLHDDRTAKLVEPWRSAWELVEESWSGAAPDETVASPSTYLIGSRIEGGERSRELIQSIVAFVEPRLKVERASWWSGKRRGRPKRREDLVEASLTSGDLVDGDDLRLATLEDADFLAALANALDAALRRGLELGRLVGWDGLHNMWRLGFLYRVEPATDVNDDVDAIHDGIAPVTKLLFRVVTRLAEVSAARVKPLVAAWRESVAGIDLRLWAALATRRPDLLSAEEVAGVLGEIDAEQFWDVHWHPEVALLRARRFSELEPSVQRDILRRIRRRPPRRQWSRAMGTDAEVEDARDFWKARELQRIVRCGGVLSAGDNAWLEAKLVRFEDLVCMDDEEGFQRGTAYLRGASVEPEPDTKYDAMEGKTRLRALEAMLAESVDPALGRSGSSWLRKPENFSIVMAEMGREDHGVGDHPCLFSWMLRAHKPTGADEERSEEVATVLRVVSELPDSALANVGVGVSEWLGTWREVVVKDLEWTSVWLRVWPVAVEATNALYQPEDEGRLNVVVSATGDNVEDLDAFNTPVARLIDVFLEACPPLDEAANAFKHGELERVRAALVGAEGQALLIVRLRLMRFLSYFLGSDSTWAEKNLVEPLLSGKEGRPALWRAVAPVLGRDALERIGDRAADAAADPLLGQRTRGSLVFSIVIDSLHAAMSDECPAIKGAVVQQMLRRVDDETRGNAADAIVRFVRDVSKSRGDSGAHEFRKVAAPFLSQTWPQERTLATRGVARAFARLPASSGEAFAAAVEAIDRFLVPFSCHALVDYGLYGTDDNGAKKLDLVLDAADGRALLRLLDRTVGTAPGVAVPFDLRNALSRIRDVDARLAVRPEFERLSSLAGQPVKP